MLHLRCLDTDVRVEFAGSGAADLFDKARKAWSRCLAEPSVTAVHRLVVVGDDPALVEVRGAPAPTEPRDPTLVEVQGALAPSLETPQPSTRHPDLTGTDHALLLDRLSPLVTLAAIEAQAGTLLMLHAAAIADPTTGRAVALVGPSGAGKTTATRVLAEHWGYLTDETVGIREDATIAPYPKPLSVKVDASPYKEQRSIDDLGLAATPSTAALHRVVLLSRDNSPEPWLEDVSTVEALALLAPETSYLSRIDRPLHRLAALLGATGLRRLHYREAAQLPDLMKQIIEED